MSKMPSTGEALIPLVVITGATAVGKTGLAIDLAKRLDGEIISADSRQVYRYMNIGTAKPTTEQRAEIPHHLLDVVDPDETLSLSQYLELAIAATSDIHTRGKLPFLVGGTGQYVTALIEGWSVPKVAPNLALRAELEAYAAQHGAEALSERLRTVDPISAENIDHRNVRRIVRAIEVTMETGQPFSALQTKHPPPYHLMRYLLTMDRARLYERADHRVDGMIDSGFVDEVRWLLDHGYAPSLPSMSGLGYAELAGHLINGTSLDAAVKAIYIATHDFIRRQETWFRKHDPEPQVTWLDAENFDLDRVAGLIAKQVNG
jgi:tRNA dimethylallyltransferase